MQVTDWRELASDGDTYQLTEDRVLRLRVAADEYLTIDDVEDPEVFGELACVDDARARAYRRDYAHHAPRPACMDGRARKVGRRRDYWWQPPADIADADLAAAASRVTELLEYGYVSVGLEVLEGEDAYHRPIVTHAAWIGGVEPSPDAAYLRELIGDLAVECNVELTTEDGE